MACHAEHWFVLDFALSHASWAGGQFGYAGWQEERRLWRATTMRDILPPNPVSKVGPGWRPESARREGQR